MSTDLENDLRDALRARAATITADRLQHPAAPPRTPRRPLGAWLAVAAAAVVVVLAVTIVALHRTDSNPSRPPAAARSLAGTSWRVSVSTDVKTNASFRVAGQTVRFGAGGAFRASDEANSYAGRWRVEGDQLYLSDMSGTLAGLIYHGPTSVAGPLSIQTLTGTRGPITVRLGRDRLELSTPTLVLDLVPAKGGLDPGFDGDTSEPSAPVSPTGTPTGGAPGSYVNGSEIAPAPGAS